MVPLHTDDDEMPSPEQWIDGATSKSIKKRRRLVTTLWVKANGFPSASEGIKYVLQNNCIYQSIKSAVDALIAAKLSFNTIDTYRKCYRTFVEACIAKLDERKFERNVTKPPQPDQNDAPTGYYQKEALCPTREQFVEMLAQSNPRQKAILEFMANTGWRIEEVLTRKRTDMEFDYKANGYTIPARVRLDVASSKKKYLRYAYLSHEAVKRVTEYWRLVRLDSKWSFRVFGQRRLTLTCHSNPYVESWSQSTSK